MRIREKHAALLTCQYLESELEDACIQPLIIQIVIITNIGR